MLHIAGLPRIRRRLRIAHSLLGQQSNHAALDLRRTQCFDGMSEVFDRPHLTAVVHQRDADYVHLRIEDVGAVHGGVHPLHLDVRSIRA